MKLILVSFSLDLLADNLSITICLLHEKLKKTKIITNTYWMVDSTCTVSYPATGDFMKKVLQLPVCTRDR